MPDDVPSTKPDHERLFAALLASLADETTVHCGHDYARFREDSLRLVPHVSLPHLISQIQAATGWPFGMAHEVAMDGTYCVTTKLSSNPGPCVIHIVLAPEGMGEDTAWVWEGYPEATLAVLCLLVREGLKDRPALACTLVR